MQRPQTTNAAHIYAFKKGYRMAMEGKPLNYMPSQIRYDEQMRQYFQMGWDQFQDELTNGEKEENKSPWRSRFAWSFMALIAGLGTASLMIQEMERRASPAKPSEASIKAETEPQKTKDESQSVKNSTKTTEVAKILSPDLVEAKTPQQKQPADSLRLLSGTAEASEPNITPSQNLETAAPATEKKPNEKVMLTQEVSAEMLSLLNPDARKDLKQLKQQAQSQAAITLHPLIKSSIKIQQPVLAEKVENRYPINLLSSPVPKYIRQVYFFAQVQNAKGQTIYHRWLYKGKMMAEVPLKIGSDQYRTWSSKHLSSAWAGRWTIEVLNEQKQPIYRFQFNYIK